MIAGFCDMFDGKIASTMKTRTKSEKRFGIQIDSLSDLICFGALPASIGYLCGARSIFALIVSMAFLLGALIRLAWFNVNEEERQESEDGCRKAYLGLPVTSSAVIVPFFIGLGYLLELPMDKIFPVILLAVAILFITPFKMKKPALIGKLILISLGILSLVFVLTGL
jgi:CDP-diacylglycerol--serine O-phosphatidyltransferase